jgi:hypothetical protein
LGHDSRPGWLSNSKGKSLLYDNCGDVFRTRGTVLHSFATFTQLASIEGSTLRAPEGEPDDRADSYALACQARSIKVDPHDGPIVWNPNTFPFPEAERPVTLQDTLRDLGYTNPDGSWADSDDPPRWFERPASGGW